MRVKLLGIILVCLLVTLSSCGVVSADVWVSGYFRSDGTYVRGHWRSDPDGIPYNNWSFPGNVNPYTGGVADGNSWTYLNDYYRSSSTFNVEGVLALSSGAGPAGPGDELPSDVAVYGNDKVEAEVGEAFFNEFKIRLQIAKMLEAIVRNNSYGSSDVREDALDYVEDLASHIKHASSEPAIKVELTKDSTQFNNVSVIEGVARNNSEEVVRNPLAALVVYDYNNDVAGVFFRTINEEVDPGDLFLFRIEFNRPSSSMSYEVIFLTSKPEPGFLEGFLR